MERVDKSRNQYQNTLHSEISTNEVRGILWDYNQKLSKHDLYFRKQDKLMRNAIIPPHEIRKINEKMKF